MNKFSTNFLNELFLLCFYKKQVVEIVSEHLKYEYIPKELPEYKKILKSITTIYKNTEKLPSIGTVSQQHVNDLKVQEKLTRIKETKLPDAEMTLDTLEQHLKLAKFEILNEKVFEMYNSGENQASILLSATESQKITEFTIKKSGSYFKKVFGDFESTIIKKQEENQNRQEYKTKVPLSIPSVDRMLYGGMDITDTGLLILRSGVGKSTALKWSGMGACRLGFNVLHVQLEGSQDECYDKYTQLWTACLYNEVRTGNINDKKYEKLQKSLDWFKQQDRDIYIHAFEQFNSASMSDVRDLAIDFAKVRGQVDLIIIDYLSELHPGDGIKYSYDTQSVKMRKENSARKMKNVATELGTRILTADQVVGVSKELWNDPSKTLDRYNIAGAKNLVDSFSIVITGNQTEKEKEEDMMRLYIDKCRNYKIEEKIVKIATNYDHGRFYNHRKTLEMFYGK